MYHNREDGNNRLVQEQGSTLSIGGATRLATQLGDIALKGTTLVSQGDVNINAAKNLILTTANTTKGQAENANMQSIGGIDISATEKFYGYHRELNDFYGNQQTHEGSQITSLDGNVTLSAGENYRQTSSDVLSTHNTTITAKALGINTELKGANEKVENTLNLDRTLEEHRAVANAMANIQEAASYYMADRQREAEEELKKVKEQGYSEQSEKYQTAKQAVDAWSIGGGKKQTIDTVTAVVGAVLGGGSAGQIGVAALSPTANNLIHEATKDDKTKITNILAHAVLGAIEAKASGTSATSGAVAAAGAEMIANTIAKAFYGVDGVNKTIDSLTNDEKENILTLSQLGSAVLGGVTGDSGYATAVSGEIGKRAVEYNSLKVAKTLVKIVIKTAEKYKKSGKLKGDELKKILKDEGLDIADNLYTLLDGELNWDDAVAVINLAVGTELELANKGKFAQKLDELNKYIDSKITYRPVSRVSGNKTNDFTFEKAPYHSKSSNELKSANPTFGQEVLNESLQIKSTSARRIGVDKSTGEYVVFDNTINNIYHGHVRTWDELTPEMQNVLKNAGLVNKKGKIN